MKYVLTLAVVASMFAAEPQGFLVWKGSDLKGFDKTLAQKIDGHKAATEDVGKGGYQTLIVHREGDGEPELDETDVLLIVENGEATLAAGGAKTALTEGDVALIPANLPHQVLVVPGKRVTYLILRQARHDAAAEDATSSVPPPAKKPEIGIELGAGYRSCVAGDDSPAGTVVDGYRKMYSKNFLGHSCLWQPEHAPEPVKEVSTGDKERPRLGVEVGDGYRSCVPGDDSPNGTIVDGYKKLSNPSPFGVSCGWQKIK
jgi:hypothetical protein